MAKIYLDGVTRFLEGDVLDDPVQIDEKVVAHDITMFFFDSVCRPDSEFRPGGPTRDQCGRIVSVIQDVSYDRWVSMLADTINVAIGNQYRASREYREAHPDRACEHLPVFGL